VNRFFENQKYQNIMTKNNIINKTIPDGFKDFWDNFNLKLYEKYIKEKEKYILNKSKK